MSAQPPPLAAAASRHSDEGRSSVDQWHDAEHSMERPGTLDSAPAPSHDATTEEPHQGQDPSPPLADFSPHPSASFQAHATATGSASEDGSLLAQGRNAGAQEPQPPQPSSIDPSSQHHTASSAFLPRSFHTELTSGSAPDHQDRKESAPEPVHPYLHRPRRGSGSASIAPARPPSLFNQNEYTDLPGNITIGPQSQAVTHTLRRRLFVPYPQLDVVLGAQGSLLNPAQDAESRPRVTFEGDNMHAQPGSVSAYDFVKSIVHARRRKLDADSAGAAAALQEHATSTKHREPLSSAGNAASDTQSGLAQLNASNIAEATTGDVLFDDAFLDSPPSTPRSLPHEGAHVEPVHTSDTDTDRAHPDQADEALERSLRGMNLVEAVAGEGPRIASDLRPDDLFTPDPRPWKALRWVRRTDPRHILIYVAGAVPPRTQEAMPGGAGKSLVSKSSARGGIGVVFSPPSEADPWNKYSARNKIATTEHQEGFGVQVTSPDGVETEISLPAAQDRREVDLARRLEATPTSTRATPQRAVLRAALAALEWMDWWRPAPAGAGAKAIVLAVAEPWVASGISGWIAGWRRDGWILSGLEEQRQLGPAGARVPDRDLWELLDAVISQYEQAGCGVLFWALPESTPGLAAARAAAVEGAARPKQQPALVRWRKKEAQNVGAQPVKGAPSAKPKSKKPAPSATPMNARALSQGIGLALSASIVKNNPRAAQHLFSGKR